MGNTERSMHGSESAERSREAKWFIFSLPSVFDMDNLQWCTCVGLHHKEELLTPPYQESSTGIGHQRRSHGHVLLDFV